jgi:hypothetical protein
MTDLPDGTDRAEATRPSIGAIWPRDRNADAQCRACLHHDRLDPELFVPAPTELWDNGHS